MSDTMMQSAFGRHDINNSWYFVLKVPLSRQKSMTTPHDFFGGGGACAGPSHVNRGSSEGSMLAN